MGNQTPEPAQSFGIFVKNTLLDPKHVKAMQVSQKTTSLWLYLWFLDKVTRIDKDTQLGWVLGGKPIKLGEVCPDLGLDIKTARKMFHNLRDHDYIEVTQAPYGSVVKVTKAVKIFGNKYGRSGNVDKSKSGRSESQNEQNVVGLGSKSGRSNKTVQLDSTIKTIQSDSSVFGTGYRNAKETIARIRANAT